MKNLEDKRKTAAHRLAIIAGHLRKVHKMVDQGDSCVDIIHQSRAIQQALRKFDAQIMGQHLRVCVRRDLVQGGAERADEKIDGLLNLFERYN